MYYRKRLSTSIFPAYVTLELRLRQIATSCFVRHDVFYSMVRLSKYSSCLGIFYLKKVSLVVRRSCYLGSL